MSYVNTRAKSKLISGDIDLNADDIRVLLVGATTTVDTEVDKEFIDDYAILDECNATNYVRKALTGEAVAPDLPNARGEFDANDVTWTALGNGTNFTIVGALVFKFVSDDSDSIPIAYIDSGGFPKGTNGSDFKITWNVEGILQAT